MKSLQLFFFIALAFTVTTNAQITKGNWMFGGDATFYSFITEREEQETSRSTSITVNPNINYFVIDKLAVGLKIGTSFNKNNTSLGISPVARYYFLDTDKIFNIFTEASFGYGINIPKERDSYSSTGFTTKLGGVVFLNQSVGLEFGINYRRGKDGLNNNIYNTIKVAFGLQIHLEK